MNHVGSKWPKWGWNGPSALDTYLMFLFEAQAVSNGYCIYENEAVDKNASTPKYQLRKKYHSISYHMSSEAVASGAYMTRGRDTDNNL